VAKGAVSVLADISELCREIGCKRYKCLKPCQLHVTKIVCYGRYPHYMRWSGLPTDPLEQGSDRLMMHYLKKMQDFRFEDGRIIIGNSFLTGQDNQ
jgi:hypothetical protein